MKSAKNKRLTDAKIKRLHSTPLQIAAKWHIHFASWTKTELKSLIDKRNLKNTNNDVNFDFNEAFITKEKGAH